VLSRAVLDDLGLALDADCEFLPVAGEAGGGRRALGRELLAERTAVSRGLLFDSAGLLVGGSLDALRGARACCRELIEQVTGQLAKRLD
jgi:hypothetical protein